jgi:tetratricopeptide (TPR) repeat protein
MPRSTVTRALEGLIDQGDGTTFERLARRLLARRYPDLIPTAPNNDLGRDSTFTLDGRRAVLCASHTATKAKVVADVERAQAASGAFEVAVFCTPRSVTDKKIAEWRAAVTELGVDLEVRARDWVVDECLLRENLWTTISELKLSRTDIAQLFPESIGLYVWQDDDIRSDAVDGAAIEPGEAVDVTMLGAGRLPDLQREFAQLTEMFERWLAEGQTKRGGARIRVFWLVGEPVPHRSKGLLACLARAHTNGRPVCDTGRDLGPTAKVLEGCMLGQGPSPAPIVGVDLDADVPTTGWTEIARLVTQARKSSSVGADSYPRLVVAGTEEQAQAADDALQALVEIRTHRTSGRPDARPDSHEGILRSPEHVFNRGLPMTARKLFGRHDDLERLRQAWASERARVVSVVAFGGTGKSALVNSWLHELQETGFQGADKVLAWSFYSQGTKDNLVSADEFVSTALRWLGDDGAAVSLNPWPKGKRLAALIKRHRLLLVLDGMEPLQHPPDAPEVGGRLTDDSVRALLNELAVDDWGGLCVITTRVMLTDLRPFEAGGAQSRGTVSQIALRNLDDRAGADLLEHLLGRPADFRKLQQVVREVDGHALAITLLGHYLRDVHGGDLAGRFDLERLTVAERDGGHARRVMATYARWLEGQQRFAELAILQLIGLFDRPAEPAAMAALLADAELRSFAAALGGVGGDVWSDTVEALRSMGLLNEANPDAIGTLDAHPLVREHFRDELRAREHALWSRGNRTLYDYYRGIAPAQPSDSKGMQPLYAAVTHGCAADLHREVFDEVLLKRVWRDRRTNFSTRRLGLTGADLVALSNYFEHRRWADLRDLRLSPRAQVLIRTNAGVRLRQLGRLLDARQCFGAVVDEIDLRTAGAEELEDASYAAAQYCELLVIAGRLTGPDGDRDTALVSGQRAVEYADRGGDAYFSMHARSSLAEVHFMLGDGERAGALFDEAEEIERTRGPRPPFLYSQSLYRYGYYRIETGRAHELLDGERNDPAWGANGEDSSLLSQAIRLLILGAARRSLIEDDGDRTPQLLLDTARILDEAIAEFRSAGYPDYIVRGLLERARFHGVRLQPDDHARAMADLDDAALETRGGQMDLLHADVLLQRVDCTLRFWPWMTTSERAAVGPGVAETLAEATRRIELLGYRRRERMLGALREQAAACGVIGGDAPTTK